MARAARLLSEHTDGQLPQKADHLSDLSLACFAISGYSAPDADDSVAHLAACPTCRHELAAVRETMEYSQEIAGEGPCQPPSVQEVMLQQLRMAFSTVPAAAYAIASGIAYVAECVMFALALAHVWLSYLVAPVGFEAVPNIFPFGLIAPGALRLWVFVAACSIAGVALRWLAASLFGRALIRASRW
ncbi:MAG: hypothetical protein ACLFWB_09240 [Armatimonadota bacterium]